MALFEGILHAEGRCLYVLAPDGSPGAVLPAFAMSGLRWNAGTRMLHIGRVAIRHGQRVVLSGGEPPNPASLVWVQRPHPSCKVSRIFVAGAVAAAKE